MLRSLLFWRLFVGNVTLVLLATSVLGILVNREVTDNSFQEINQALAVRATLLEEIAKPALAQQQFKRLQTTVVQLGKNTRSRLTVISNAGLVVADSQQHPQNMDNHGNRPEIIAAAANGQGTASRFSQTLQQQMVYLARKVVDSAKQPMGFVRISLPLTTINSKLTELRYIVLISTAPAVLAALILGFYFARKFSRPLTAMTEVAESISQGDYDKRISVKQNDEIGKLAEAFNRMAKSSAQRMEELTTDRNRLAKIFAGMVEGVIGVDQRQRIVHINHAATNLLHVTTQQCIDQPIWSVIRIKEINNALEKALQTRSVVKTQMRQSLAIDDKVVDIYIATLSDSLDTLMGAVIVLHDISELDRLERVRRDFVANASHELKTPITAIRGLVESMADDKTMAEETRQKFTERIYIQSLRLSQLVTNLITLSRLESDQNDNSVQPFNLSALIKQSAHDMEAACQEKDINLIVDIAEEILSINDDMQAIRQMVDNLTDNAIHHTPKKGSITISLSKQDNYALLRVQDTGIGISQTHQMRVFERFYRVDKARSRELGGTGLGLSIVKNIAERHGGNVSLESQLGVGSCFSVQLPLL